MLYWFFSIKGMYLRSILISFVEIVVAEGYTVMSQEKIWIQGYSMEWVNMLLIVCKSSFAT